MRPRIGITTPNKRFHLAYFCIKASVWLCGGRPVPLKVKESVKTQRVDGLVLGGGTDVFPGLFQNDPKKDYAYDHERDALEMAWLEKARSDNLPILGICRGAQMMNVMHKGTLHMDVSLAYADAHYPDSVWHRVFYRKAIDIKAGSLFAKLTGRSKMRVNSMHKQSIDRLGEHLIVTAREHNGVIQAIERPHHIFYMGVQFHPEFMVWRKDMRALFGGLVQAAAQNL